MLEKLGDEERRMTGGAIGQAIYATLTDDRANPLFDYARTDAQGLMWAPASLLCMLTGNEAVAAGLPMSYQEILDLGSGPKPHLRRGLGDTAISDHVAVEEKAGDLLVEAVDDSLDWFGLITIVKGQVPELDTLISHPSIHAATGVTDVVHKTAKAVLTKQIEAGFKPELPRNREAFIRLFYEAPYLLAELGFRLEITDADEREASEPGLCPAKMWDEIRKETWLKRLLTLTAPLFQDQVTRAQQIL